MPTAIHVLAFANMQILDVTGPLQVFASANDIARQRGLPVPYAPSVIASEGGAVMSSAGLAVLAEPLPQQASDTLIIAGGWGVYAAAQDAPLVAWVREHARGCRRVSSVCTGAFLLGRAGLLEGKCATTHWAYTHLLPLVGARHVAERVVEDGNVITAGGVTAGIDFALTLTARYAGEEAARRVQLALEYDPHPPFDSGTPSAAGEEQTRGLREHIYDAAAARMVAALV